jgi:DnaJ-domain-containing protein 1
MGIIALILIVLAGWLMWTGRLQRMTANDGIALGMAIVGAILSAKGKPVLGALPMMLSASYGVWRVRKKSYGAARRGTSAPQRAVEETVTEAAALLGVPHDADADAIRAAHRRLIASVHPDKGGTEALAAKINAARDILLRHHENFTGSRH